MESDTEVLSVQIECETCFLPVMVTELPPTKDELKEHEVECFCPECNGSIGTFVTATAIKVERVH